MAEIVMLLAYGPGLPNGDVADRLELSVKLTSQGRLDEAEFGQEPWPSRRTLPDGRLHAGELVRTDGGWALRGAAGEDAPLWHLEGGVFRPGEYVTLRRPSGESLVFRIVDVQSTHTSRPEC